MPERPRRHDDGVGLADLLDRLVGTGVAAVGDITLSVAGVDLVFVSLRALLASVATIDEHHRDAQWPGWSRPIDQDSGALPLRPPRPPIDRSWRDQAGGSASPAGRASLADGRPRADSRDEGHGDPATGLDALDQFVRHLETRPSLFRERADADPEELERGLARLVLTLVEVLRDLLERQAIRRMETGSLTDEQVERMGRTFMRLRERMEQLKEVFGIDDDLTLRLGPIRDAITDADGGDAFRSNGR